MATKSLIFEKLTIKKILIVTRPSFISSIIGKNLIITTNSG